MNILIAAEYRAPFGGNFIGSLLDLAAAIKARGDSVVFLFPKLSEGERPWCEWIRKNGYEVLFADLSTSEEEQLRFLKSVLDEKQIDLMHLHFEIYSHLIRKYAKDLKPTRILIHDHMDYATGRSETKQRLRLNALSVAYAFRGYGLITVMKKKLNAYAFMPKKCFVPNGVSMIRNVEFFSSRSATRTQLGIKDDERLAILFGWDMKRKGVDVAAQAIALLRQRGHKVLLGLIGGNAEKYRSFIGQYGVDPNSDWIRFIDSREDIYSLHRAADVLLSASRNEGFSYAILEAISQNTPVAVSDIPGTRWAEQYDKCVIYPVESSEACADAILQAIQFGDAPSNAEKIIEEYSIEKWCSRVLEIYDRMCPTVK